jgi:hypothetical protein
MIPRGRSPFFSLPTFGLFVWPAADRHLVTGDELTPAARNRFLLRLGRILCSQRTGATTRATAAARAVTPKSPAKAHGRADHNEYNNDQLQHAPMPQAPIREPTW